MSPLPPVQTLSTADIGVATFVASFGAYLVFHRYEPSSPGALISLLLLIPGVLGSVAYRYAQSSAGLNIVFISYWTLLALFASIYRLSPFHPLAKYPGPLLNRISKLESARIARKGGLNRYYHSLHQKYGDIVRVGPNELSYVNVEGVRGTLNNGMPKGPFYHRPGNTVTMLASRDAATHTRLRKPWNRAFTTAALKDYEHIVVRRARELIDNLDKRDSQKLDISEWMEFFSFDFMGDLVFSFSFDMMKDGHDVNGYWKTLTGSMKWTGIISQISWSFSYLRILMMMARRGVTTKSISEKMVSHRLKAGSMTRDVFHHLSYEDEKKSEDISTKQLVAEGIVAIIAGSDTTSTVLANLWYYLLKNPAYFARLRAEVDATFPSGEDPIDQERLVEMPYLNACINESLRLQPPVPSGSQRMVAPGAGGKTVGPHYIPEGNNVLVPFYALHRNPLYFSPYPESFWPDRWLESDSRKDIDDVSKPLGKNVQVVLEHKAFAPFSSGPASCVGKTLAQNEMRIVASWIVQRFDMRPADGYNLDKWEEDLKDYYVMQKGGLPVFLTRRK